MSNGARKTKRTMEISEMINLHRGGCSTEKIGKLSNLSTRYVLKILTDNNIEKRPHGS